MNGCARFTTSVDTRGTQLIRPAGKTASALRCPYHDWTYNLEGELIGVPRRREEFPDIDPSRLSLFPASVGVWRGMLWVHPEPDAPPVNEWFGGVEPDLGPHRVDELVERKQFRTEQIIEANWKIVVENFIDGYHLKHLHSGTLAMYDHDRIESRWHGPHFTFWEPLSADYAKDPARQSSLPLIDHIPRERLGAWVPMLFPGIGLAETESTWSLFHITPLAPERTRVVTRTKVADASSWEFAAQMLTLRLALVPGREASSRGIPPRIRWRQVTSWRRTSTPANSSRSPCVRHIFGPDRRRCTARGTGAKAPANRPGMADLTKSHGHQTLRLEPAKR